MAPQRKIIHVDMDCFYAAVEVKHRPELRGKAIAVGGAADSRGVVCTASYEARKYGVKSAMASALAKRLCPHLILLRPNFSLYKPESEAVREIFHRYTDLVEPLSLDEAYLDVSASAKHSGSATLIASEIRALIKKELGLTASAGVAPNKFLAKVASDWRKPDGLFTVAPSDVEKFVAKLPLSKIYGVGRVTAQKMAELGLHTCEDIRRHSIEQLRQWFGSRAEDYAQLARGICERSVNPHWERKSLSVEETFSRDRKTWAEWAGALPALFSDWERRISKGDYKSRIRGLVVKVKYTDFKTTTHESTTQSYPARTEFESLLRAVWEKRPDPVRLVGLGARLDSSERRPRDRRQLSFAFT